VNLRRSHNNSHLKTVPPSAPSFEERAAVDEGTFLRLISIERKRTERSRNPFLLMLLEIGEPRSSESNAPVWGKILPALSESSRETDVTGWYQNHCVLGVMFTEIGRGANDAALGAIITRTSDTLRKNLTLEQFSQLSFSFHVFPEDSDKDIRNRPSNPTLYPDLSQRARTKRVFNVMKRSMDVFGSVMGLIGFSPAFLIIAVAIKMTSTGPVLFRQQRVGQFGQPFVFLKFRSMHVNNDCRVHQEYVTKMISGTRQTTQVDGNGDGVYKLTQDPRITRFGAFLRKTSLDELPQLVNVLKGHMSLVGPRPPLPYEVEAYEVWHRRRLLEAKPGITGLWQVNGRSRVKFDDMVRLDLQYARTWSPWMDVKILLRTPVAVVLGEGAY
jgi:lipopolysaccharide/colanic/teichoic acid biosynthesis glycosyltransferase